MKMLAKLVVSCLVACAPLTSAAFADDGEAAAKEAVLEVSKRWETAAVARDVDALASVLADDFVFVAADGSTMGKNQYLALVKGSRLKLESVETEEVAVRIYDRTAVEMGVMGVRGTLDENLFDVRERYVVVYVLRDDRWQAAVHQVTRIP